ncbi:MAG: class I SAM-dependent methyltransferase [Verrucomicrobia bacterium]|nr:class I SAM-dependent methyltransferase [Verrucomicrobiota bacterium]
MCRTLLSMLFCLIFQSLQGVLPWGELDAYLRSKGVFLNPAPSHVNEGYSSELQRETFLHDLQSAPQIKSILEIGFNAGHTSELFLNGLPGSRVISFDINLHPYTRTGVEFMHGKFGDRFTFIEGDAGVKVAEYADAHPYEWVDLIFIDGGHTFNCCVADIKNCQRLAHRDTLVWINDYAPSGIKAAVDDCVQKGILTLIDVKTVTDESGTRSWAIGKYPFASVAEKAFSDIYIQGIWGKNAQGEGTSGPGSWVHHAQFFINYVENFLNSHSIQSIVDLGCGDWVLGRAINWGDRNYLGLDIIPWLIAKNQALYASERVQFKQLDVLIDPLPDGDLLICKDMLMHLPHEYVLRTLAKSKKFKYCIFVNDINPQGGAVPVPDTLVGRYRFLDLTLPPFYLQPHAVEFYPSAHAMKQILLIKNE